MLEKMKKFKYKKFIKFNLKKNYKKERKPKGKIFFIKI